MGSLVNERGAKTIHIIIIELEAALPVLSIDHRRQWFGYLRYYKKCMEPRIRNQEL